MTTILVFSPHFDDESIGCGGAIARHVVERGRVVVVFMTRGDLGDTTPGRELSPQQSEQIRKREADEALKVLGVQERDYLDLPDGFMRWEPDVIRQIARLIRRHRPEIVYAPHADDAHNDHKVTWQMVSDALPRAGWSAFPDLGEPWYVRDLRGYEVWTPISRPNFFIDITDFIEQKAQAIQQYTSQLAAAYHEAALGLNRYRGLMGAGVPYAEAFIQATVSIR